MNQPMLPTLSSTPPKEDKWMYEIKYDGFRAFLKWTKKGMTLTSRNGKDLSSYFPEIINVHGIEPPTDLPLLLDGEIVILNTPYQANFGLLQKRGRIKKSEKIQSLAKKRPATFMAFDVLQQKEDLSSHPYTKRKAILHSLLEDIDLPQIQHVTAFEDWEEIKQICFDYLGEGIVAKLRKSTYTYNKRSREWLKIKQWRTVSGFLTKYNPENEYYTLEVFDKEQRVSLGSFKHGLDSEQAQTLRTFFKEKGENWHLEPSVCVDVHCLQAEAGELREPLFNEFRFDLAPRECTEEKRRWDIAMLPEEVEASHTEKILWSKGLTKQDYLIYLRRMAPYMLPYFQKKKVTVIRYPDGIKQQSFFQKHRPDYAPDFVGGWKEEDGEVSLRADQVSSLTWLGNQGALEFHLPFQKALAKHPDEIIFDLDPPNRSSFHLSVVAAQLLKHLLDKLEVRSFVKTSGNKGLQIHIPIEEGSLSYEETRKFIESLAKLIVKEKPDIFTTERLKKKRGDRLYVDYVQHAEGKTIIAPYSARATEEASVATPLFWSELKESLDPTAFTIENVAERVQEFGCPFQDYDQFRQLQPIEIMKEL
ncbi:DNA ligase D [Halobacillus seohaensis]|uniref:DNA ligase D n=1 Tax=Halobacillus seohaensis TaxID=447421 RepID=A0ABW2EKL4_9BACI